MNSQTTYQRRRFEPKDRETAELWDLLCNELWDLLNEDAMVSRMVLLSRKGIPAVAALDSDAERIWESLRVAKAAGLENPVKQKIGKMVREILESESVGLEWAGSARINSWIFSSGAKYRHPDWRPIHVHTLKDGNFDEFCVSRRKHLADLDKSPSTPSSWIYYRRCLMQHELEYVLDVENLEQFDWDENTTLTWKALCRRVRSESYKILWRKAI